MSLSDSSAFGVRILSMSSLNELSSNLNIEIPFVPPNKKWSPLIAVTAPIVLLFNPSVSRKVNHVSFDRQLTPPPNVPAHILSPS